MSVERKNLENARDADIDARAKKLEGDLAELEAEGAKSDVRRKVREGGEREQRQIRDRAQRQIDRLDEVLDTFRKLKVRDLIIDEVLYRELEDRFGDYFHGGMGAEALKQIISRLRHRRRDRDPARHHQERQGSAQDPRDQAAQGRCCVPADHQLAAGHGAGLRPGDPAGAAADGAAGRWPLRDLRPERPVPPGDQPEQPVEATDRPRRARDHRQQREADAAGGRRRTVRQRPPWPSGHRTGQPPAQVAVRSAQGQAGPVPPEPARQARRLLRPFGHRGRPAAQAAPVRPAQADGARAVQAVRDEASGRPEPRAEHQVRQADGRASALAGVGRPRRGHLRAPGAAEPRARPCTAWASRPSSRSWWKARPSSCTRWSVPRSTPTSTATRWRCTCRCPPRRRPRRAC